MYIKIKNSVLPIVLKKKTLFTIIPKKKKKKRIYMPKTIRNPRNQWRKMKEIKNYLNKWNPYFWAGTVNIVKISIFLMWIYRFNAISIKISSRFLVDRDKISLKFIWKDIGTTVAKTVSKEKNGGFPGVSL